MNISFLHKVRLIAACKRGATAIEYALIAAGVALVIIVSVNAAGLSVSNVLMNVSNSFVAGGGEDDLGGGCGSPGGCDGGGGPISDKRLKHDIHLLRTTGKGLKLYTFKYLNDERIFVGVMAQDLLADKRFRASVITMPSGYYAVDYKKLGIRPINGKAMEKAGKRALVYALSQN